MQQWIGPKFTDQICVHGVIRDYLLAPQGEQGKEGGKGGQKGVGGNHGEIVILGTDLVQPELNNGPVGAHNGVGGNGGTGGANGMALRGRMWTNCRISGEVSPAPADRWHDGPRYEPPATAGAANGTPPTAQSATAPAAPPAITPINRMVALQAYLAYYREKAQNPLISPFILPFPGLEQ